VNVPPFHVVSDKVVFYHPTSAYYIDDLIDDVKRFRIRHL